jgi:quercetin dioxygenase-like cupin family protein
MRIVRSKKTIALAAAALVAVALAATALSGVLAQDVPVDTVGGIHFRVVSTSADGFDSGWHTHPGLAIVQVREGSLQITQGSCTPKTVGPGETSIEVPYTPVRAVATGKVVWTTTFLLKLEDPERTAVPSPCP